MFGWLCAAMSDLAELRPAEALQQVRRRRPQTRWGRVPAPQRRRGSQAAAQVARVGRAAPLDNLVAQSGRRIAAGPRGPLQ
eukprot:10300097-Alexandrium_andersonii.AAC.1